MLTHKEFIEIYRKMYLSIHTPIEVIVPGHERAKQCQICLKVCRTVYDHCHDTNLFRGWLCNNCNTALGMVENDVTILWSMIKYLMSFRESLKIRRKSDEINTKVTNL